jgi:hypothetical protein
MPRRLRLLLGLVALAALSAAAPAISAPWGPGSAGSASPTARIVSAPPPDSSSGAPTFAFESTDGGVSFVCSLDGAAFEPCTSPRSFSALNDGAHSFSVKAADANGTLGDPATYSWKIDTVAPSATITSGPSASTASRSASFTFASNEPAVSFSCSLDGGPSALCVSPQDYRALAPGKHAFSVQATDPAGNTSAAASLAWTVTATDPAPGNVRRLRTQIGYGFVKLSWTRPADNDFDHVYILRAAGDATSAIPVFGGTDNGYEDKGINNARAYRYRIVSFDKAGNESPGVRVLVSPDALLLLPKAGRRVAERPRFAWTPVPRAALYNVQLYRNGRKVLSTWPKSAGFRLGRTWRYGGHAYRLTRGQYRWYVWPAFGRVGHVQYGAPLGQSSFDF